ncbi:MAG: hypothetical protein HY244_02720 [Rhizobiales bacterium]|nr:hypothetical protein [Hyphomicrobiales bacterium]
MNIETRPAEHDAWNPGLQSELPREFLPLSTMFRSENVSTGVAKAYELSDYCGLPVHELVAFRAERLIVHELLIRVTARLSVPDGTKYRDLGANFRAIASTILNKYISPHQEELARFFEQVKSAASAKIMQELSNLLSPAIKPAVVADESGRWGLPFNLGKPKKPPAPPAEGAEARVRRIFSQWREKSETADDRLDKSCFHALSRIATAVISRRGRLFGNKELLAELAVTLVCNDYGSEVIGDALDPFFQEAVAREGYRRLPAQQKPVVMNVKGASASGKSTMRPLQRILAKKLNLPWEEFALISPDIWRKFLLDYDSLGAAYKYAGTMTGHELEIIDEKLDRYMAAKAATGEMTHLLIDRFRFDSFVPVAEGKGTARLLTRFGELVYMFFMITPPEMTVERAWLRGLKVGRYKAVDDLLAHNIEAYTGMPELFFTWALNARKRVHYEFLDNSVAEGCPPRTVAFGWNREMTILDIKSMLDIDRFRKINIHAQKPEEVYAGDNLAPESNVEFLKRCARLIPVINFADYATGQVYARLERGRWTWRDEQRFAGALADPDAKAGLQAIAAEPYDSAAGTPVARSDLASAKAHTLGAWGEAISTG